MVRVQSGKNYALNREGESIWDFNNHATIYALDIGMWTKLTTHANSWNDMPNLGIKNCFTKLTINILPKTSLFLHIMSRHDL